MFNPFKVVQDFEAALCEYTGAPYCVTTTSCTMALLLAVAWHLRDEPNPHNLFRPTPRIRPGNRPDATQWTEVRQAQIEIPSRTYVGVPMSIIHAGGWPIFRDENWSVMYQLKPLPVWDSARRFRRMVYADAFMRGGGFEMPFVCLSFHWSKTLGVEQGGAILHSDPAADVWLRKARFDGRTEGVPVGQDRIDVLGYHAYMSPKTAAKGLMRLSLLKGDEPDLPNSHYPDLSQMEIFK